MIKFLFFISYKVFINIIPQATLLSKSVASFLGSIFNQLNNTFSNIMSAIKQYIDANCFYNKSSNQFNFIDNYSDNPPNHIMKQRLHNAGLKDNSSSEIFRYECSDLERHKFYQKLHRGVTVTIDEEWYNTYLEMQQPSNWLCTVQYHENSKIISRKVDFIITINEHDIAFWFNKETKHFYCRTVTSPNTI